MQVFNQTASLIPFGLGYPVLAAVEAARTLVETQVLVRLGAAAAEVFWVGMCEKMFSRYTSKIFRSISHCSHEVLKNSHEVFQQKLCPGGVEKIRQIVPMRCSKN